MPHIHRPLCATAALLALAVLLPGADRAVSTVAELTAAANATAAGDTITLAGGTYALTSALILGVDAPASAPILVRAAPGAAVIIDGGSAGTDYAIGLTGSHITLQDIELAHGGISLYQGQDITVLRCSIHDSRNSGIWIGKGSRAASGIVIDHCSVFHCIHINDGHPAGVTWGQGISVGLGTLGATVASCSVYENQGEGIGAYACDAIRITDSVAHDNFGADIYLDSATNVTVDRCTAYSLGNAIYFRSYFVGDPAHREVALQTANEDYAAFGWTAKLTNITITNCVLMNAYAAFIYGDYSAGGGISTLRFLNNTCYAGTQELLMFQQPNGSASHQDCVFRDNVFVQTGGHPMFALYGGTAAVPAGVTFDHNCWQGGGAVGAPGIGDVLADPLLVAPSATSATAADFALQAASPAKDTGSASGAPDHDHAGSARPQGSGIDLGAFELAGPPAANHAPTAACSATPTTGTAPLAVTFATTGSQDADGDALSFSWSFGDGATGSGSAPAHTYASAGSFTATVTASDGHGGTATAAAVITVNGASTTPPPAITSTAHATGTVGTPFHYAIVATNHPLSFTAAGLPPGWTVDAVSGMITGMPTVTGTLHITLGAANAGGRATQALDVDIAAAGPATPPPASGGAGSSSSSGGGGCGHGIAVAVLAIGLSLAFARGGGRNSRR